MRVGRTVLISLLGTVALLLAVLAGWVVWERSRNPLHVLRRPPGDVQIASDSAYEVLTKSGERRTFRDLIFTTERIGTIRVTISSPLAGTSMRLPLVIVLGGLRTGRESLAFIHTHGSNVLVGFEYPYDQDRLNRESKVAQLSAIRRAILDVPAQVILITDHLATMPWVESGRTALLGYSFGAMFVPATQRLAEDGEIPFDALILAFAGTDIRALIEASLRVEPALLRRVIAWIAATALHAMEPAMHLPHLSGKFLVIRGDQDARIPTALSDRLAALTPEPKEVVTLEAGHMDPRDPELTARVVRISQDWLVRQRLIDLPEPQR